MMPMAHLPGSSARSPGGSTVWLAPLPGRVHGPLPGRVHGLTRPAPRPDSAPSRADPWPYLHVPGPHFVNLIIRPWGHLFTKTIFQNYGWQMIECMLTLSIYMYAKLDFLCKYVPFACCSKLYEFVPIYIIFAILNWKIRSPCLYYCQVVSIYLANIVTDQWQHIEYNLIWQTWLSISSSH